MSVHEIGMEVGEPEMIESVVRRYWLVFWVGGPYSRPFLVVFGAIQTIPLGDNMIWRQRSFGW